MQNTTPPGFLTIGHICHDKIKEGWLPGGAASYTGLLAHRLGQNTAILTSFGVDFLFKNLFEGIRLDAVPAPQTTIFENIYHNGERQQYLHGKAADLLPVHLPAEWLKAETVLLGPIADEVSFDFLDVFENAVLCACPQGWMRKWDAAGKVSAKQLENWERIAKADIISMSESDVTGDWHLIEAIAGMANILAVTQSEQGTVIFEKGKKHHFPSYPALETDPTGAGDVFATAFLLKYAASRDIGEAAAYAHSAASLCVEQTGVAGVPGREETEARFEEYKRLFL